MISYKKLWSYIEKHNISQYKLVKEGISHSTLERLKNGEAVRIDTIDKLCKILDCKIEDIIEYVKP